MKTILIGIIFLIASVASFAQMTVIGLDEKEAIKSLKKQFKDSDLKSGEKFKLEGMDAHIMELTGEDVDIYLVMSEGLCLGSISKVTYSDEMYLAFLDVIGEGRKQVEDDTWVANDPDINMDIYFRLFTSKDNSLIYLITTPIDLMDYLYSLTQ
jgi:hypothetical protein